MGVDFFSGSVDSVGLTAISFNDSFMFVYHISHHVFIGRISLLLQVLNRRLMGVTMMIKSLSNRG